MPRRRKRKALPPTLSAAEVLKYAKKEEKRWNTVIVKHPGLPRTYIVQRISLRQQ